MQLTPKLDGVPRARIGTAGRVPAVSGSQPSTVFFFLWFFLSGLTSPRLGFLGFLLPSLTPEMPLLEGNGPAEARKGQVSRWGCVFCFCSVVT